MPWNRETPTGYFGEIIFGTISAQPYFLLNGVILLVYILMCLFHRTFFEIFSRLLRKLETPDKNENDVKIVFDLIRLHVQVKR